jgi:hypothetical protein
VYAITTPSNVYHLLTETKRETLCGKPIVDGVYATLAESHLGSFPLIRVLNIPQNRALCPDCHKAERHETSDHRRA